MRVSHSISLPWLSNVFFQYSLIRLYFAFLHVFLYVKITLVSDQSWESYLTSLCLSCKMVIIFLLYRIIVRIKQYMYSSLDEHLTYSIVRISIVVVVIIILSSSLPELLLFTYGFPRCWLEGME